MEETFFMMLKDVEKCIDEAIDYLERLRGDWFIYNIYLDEQEFIKTVTKKVKDAVSTFEAFYSYSQSVIMDEGVSKYRKFIERMDLVSIKYNKMLNLCEAR